MAASDPSLGLSEDAEELTLLSVCRFTSFYVVRHFNSSSLPILPFISFTQKNK